MTEEHKDYDIEDEEYDSDEESVVSNSYEQALMKADEIRDQRVTENTRKSYANKIKGWVTWLSNHYPNPDLLVRDGELLLPIPSKAIYAYLAGNSERVCKTTGKMIFKAASTVFGYYSALKFLYEENGVLWNGDKEVSDFLIGYKNKVSTLFYFFKI